MIGEDCSFLTYLRGFRGLLRAEATFRRLPMKQLNYRKSDAGGCSIPIDPKKAGPILRVSNFCGDVGCRSEGSNRGAVALQQCMLQSCTSAPSSARFILCQPTSPAQVSARQRMPLMPSVRPQIVFRPTAGSTQTIFGACMAPGTNRTPKLGSERTVDRTESSLHLEITNWGCHRGY
jgi:hypothetical protein